MPRSLREYFCRLTMLVLAIAHANAALMIFPAGGRFTLSRHTRLF